jgi:hypothetical protein
LLKEYLHKISQTTARGDAREESYYSPLASFIESFATSIGRKQIEITTLPKKTEAGNPDFRIWDGMQSIVGYIEAKTPAQNLDQIETSEQLKRYRETFPNLILTNFYEFRLYRNGERIDTVQIARPFIAKKLQTIPPIENEEKFLSLLEKFFSFTLPAVSTAEQLAAELAKRTRFLRDKVITIELEEEHKGHGRLFGFFDAFKKYLIANLNKNDFADIYSQTVTYGLFAARTRSTNGFSRKLAFDLIPQTIGILRDVFQFISLGNLPKQMEVIIDDIAEVLNVADVKNILHQYFSKGKGEDPIVHFYETFLDVYDPKTREKRGVYYTPEPVVRYIVRSVHQLLQTHFDLDDGLASKEVTLLDPAGGTLTFPAEAIKLAVKEFTDKYADGGLHKFISNHILKNFYAFELMMAPYAIGHIKISFLLDELGYTMNDDERFKLYLTNTLDTVDLSQSSIPGLESLSEESHLAGYVKKKEPILVIVGNPPYSGISANMNDWTKNFLKQDLDGALSFYKVDGEPLGEKKLWLQDDYVKFLRFAQWKIQKAGKGIVGMITNHSYLDNPTFRGMRQSLMHTFNEIYLLDLHGNSLKKETASDGSADENVFDIRQGTAIAIFVKKENEKGCKIYHTDLFGLRETKYDWLDSHRLRAKNYEKIQPETPWYFFIQRNTKGIEHYNEWMKVNEIFPVNVTGIVTARDEFAIDFEKSTLKSRIMEFRNKSLPDDFIKQSFELSENYMWKVSDARKSLIADEKWEDFFEIILYRPFDKRHIYLHDSVTWRPRKNVMRHMLKENICLITPKRVETKIPWSHAFVSDEIIDHVAVSLKTIDYCFPLYLYEEDEKEKKPTRKFGTYLALFEPLTPYGKKEKVPNIAPIVFELLQKAYKKNITPEQVLHYVYAVLYSNTYRKKYAEFLKIDFPRIPFTSDFKVFLQMAELGEELTELHLRFDKIESKHIVRYFGKGSNVIEKITYDEKAKRIYINKTQYFEGVSQSVWEYHIGGYQVLKRYLDWRKGRELNEYQTYCKIVAAITLTIPLQKKIDTVFQKAEKNVIGFE